MTALDHVREDLQKLIDEYSYFHALARHRKDWSAADRYKSIVGYYEECLHQFESMSRIEVTIG